MGGSTKVGDCSGRKPGRGRRRAEPGAGDVKGRGISPGESRGSAARPQGCGAGCSSPRPISPPLPPPPARPSPASPLVGKFLEPLPSGLCGSNMAELTVEVRGSNGAFYKVPSCRRVGSSGGRGGFGGGLVVPGSEVWRRPGRPGKTPEAPGFPASPPLRPRFNGLGVRLSVMFLEQTSDTACVFPPRETFPLGARAGLGRPVRRSRVPAGREQARAPRGGGA